MISITSSLNLLIWISFIAQISSVKVRSIQSTPSNSTFHPLKKIEVLEKILHEKDYDETHLPPTSIENGTSTPVVISVGVKLRSVENLDDVKMQFSTQILFWQEWMDSRLSYEDLNPEKQIEDYLLVPRKGDYEIWKPDIFFSNEKSGHLHHLIVPNSYTRLYRNGTILESFRISLVLSCDMDLHAYPLDIQNCPLRMETYGWTNEDLILQWRKDAAIIIPKSFSTARFSLMEIYETPCLTKSPTGSYSCLTLNIKFAREFGYYLIQIYLPCSMLVIVSWVSFWLEPSAVEARLSLGVTTILAVVTQTYGINQNAPPASYAKALDVWTAFCQAMVFGALLEFACVNYFCHKLKMKANRIMKSKKEEMELTTEEVQIQEESEEHVMWKITVKAKKIDRASRIIFPGVFALFNVLYWFKYLTF